MERGNRQKEKKIFSIPHKRLFLFFKVKTVLYVLVLKLFRKWDILNARENNSTTQMTFRYQIIYSLNIVRLRDVRILR